MARKERDYISRIGQLEEQSAKSGSKSEEIAKLKEEFARQEQTYQQQIRELEIKVSQTPKVGEDWALADEIEKTLKIQLEAMRITQEEFNKR
jgi:hypothetical protein